ncbi:DUF1415 domain-containing protein [Marinobacter halodurans]|uniref:DUF1415 domain-containing protein n=1 Tax=Marinobacter halodurans TaxID=2528979 RepID=A0ABY1ZI11_9GAMM|nr:DUF1415 domain-containing protein [Marinobacter halodurans]TBW49813.1 DUF1415 domain-containing protein [Marinobacter halodurans]
MPDSTDQAIAATRAWVETAVIGLNLCPFARAPYVRSQVHFAVTDATDDEGIAEGLLAEIQQLQARPVEERETTLLILTEGLADFDAFNDFLGLADNLLAHLGLDGTFQIASFHPDYRFADTPADAIDNYSNRSPLPILHILREDSVAQAAEAMDDPDAIYRANIDRLRALGHDGWHRLWQEDTPPDSR